MLTKQDRSHSPQAKRIAGIEVRSKRELIYLLSSTTILLLSAAIFIFTLIKTYFLYQDIKIIQRENRFLNKQLSLIRSTDPQKLKKQFDATTQQLPQHINLSELANQINQQATQHGLDIVQLSVSEEVTVREEQIGDKKLNKTITIKKIYIPIQLKGPLYNQIRFLEYMRQKNTNLWFDAVRLNQLQNTESNEYRQLPPQVTWNLRLQLMQIVFPYLKLKPSEVIDLIYQLQLENILE